MINVVKRTGHSSYYVEKGMAAMGKTPKQMGLQGEFRVNGGGEESSSRMKTSLTVTSVSHLAFGRMHHKEFDTLSRTVVERALLSNRDSRLLFRIIARRPPSARRVLSSLRLTDRDFSWSRRQYETISTSSPETPRPTLSELICPPRARFPIQA